MRGVRQAGESVLLRGSARNWWLFFLEKNCGRRERTADCAGYVLGSAIWSLESFSERESSAVRNCLAKDISVILGDRSYHPFYL